MHTLEISNATYGNKNEKFSITYVLSIQFLTFPGD